MWQNIAIKLESSIVNIKCDFKKRHKYFYNKKNVEVPKYAFLQIWHNVGIFFVLLSPR